MEWETGPELCGSAWYCICFSTEKPKSKGKFICFWYLFAHLRRNCVGKNLGKETYSTGMKKNCLQVSTSSHSDIATTQESTESPRIPEMDA